MEILLINNITLHLEKLKEVLTEHRVKTIPFYQYPDEVENFDMVILSGGSIFKVEGNEYRYKKEMELIKKCPIPLFGICLGFELMCKTYGANVEKLNRRINRIKKIQVIKEDIIFEGIDELSVYSNHGHAIKEVKNLIPLAKSDTGVEIVKHPKKLSYGVQFHPEIKVCCNEGYKILENFIKICS